MTSLKTNKLLLLLLLIMPAAVHGTGWQSLDSLESRLVPSDPLMIFDGISTVSLYSSLLLPLPDIIRSEDSLSDAGTYTAALGVSYGIKEYLKQISGRIRPDGEIHSFPSGHAAGSGTALGFLVYMNRHREEASPGYLYAAVSLQGITAVGRVLSGSHYPTDVLAGFLIGAAAGYLVPAAADLLFGR